MPKKKELRGRPSRAETGVAEPLTKEDKDRIVQTALANMVPPQKADESPVDNVLARNEVDIWTGLTDRQKVIQTMKLQGISQTTIAKTLGISNAMVTIEIKNIRKIHANNGAALEAEEYIGEVVALQQVIEQEMWLIVAKEKKKGNNSLVIQALQGVQNARTATTKLLMDIGMVKKKAEEVKHTHEGEISHSHAHMHTNPILDSMDAEQKASFGRKLIQAQLSDLEGPTPPSEEEYVVEYEEDKEKPKD